jgi:hypothetical protein
MHRSRLSGFSIDTQAADLDAAAAFWSAALHMHDVGADGNYHTLDARMRDFTIEVQRVDHPSRLHLDIESDDVDAEVARLEALGATRVARVKTWVVMEAPTGHRFCVIRAKDLDSKPGVNVWP